MPLLIMEMFLLNSLPVVINQNWFGLLGKTIASRPVPHSQWICPYNR